ncbi:hypothetical protein H8B09_07115 [Paenibacillus sp. PR3]|uniref:Uncharacterized protein n=1 Tax=Paenibacillus terricola TaxID=2763503 RepID=A0ABR8MSA1_9BACL|nr:hypothetical protein [Paenibacillus terricola]MBD3918520.1 hypothetical protein [Paenibacillus terricola]
MKFSLTGLIGSFLCIVLSSILLFWNPYSSFKISTDTGMVVFMMLILPACCGVAASIFKVRYLMGIVFIWSLPYGIYLSAASIPSLYNLFAVVLILYLVSVITLKRLKAE